MLRHLIILTQFYFFTFFLPDGEYKSIGLNPKYEIWFEFNTISDFYIRYGLMTLVAAYSFEIWFEFNTNSDF